MRIKCNKPHLWSKFNWNDHRYKTFLKILAVKIVVKFHLDNLSVNHLFLIYLLIYQLISIKYLP